MSNHEDERPDLEKELDQRAIDIFEQIEKDMDIRDCRDRKMQKYEHDHPCEYCMAEIEFPELKQLEGETGDALLQRRLDVMAKIVPKHLEKCRKKAKRKARLKRLPSETDCLCLLILRLAAMWGYSYQEIGKILGKAEDAVTKMRQRCRKKVDPYFEECRDLITRNPAKK